MIQDLKESYKELEEIMKKEAIDRIVSHILSLHRKIEQLTKSRDNWKNKYEKRS